MMHNKRDDDLELWQILAKLESAIRRGDDDERRRLGAVLNRYAETQSAHVLEPHVRARATA